MINRVLLIVIDGLGVGALPDAVGYGDEGASTLGHVAAAVGGVTLPNLESLGLGHIGEFAGVRPSTHPFGCFGKMGHVSTGRDSLTGHWELAGLVVTQAFPVYPQGLPVEVIDPFMREIGRKVLGNRRGRGAAMIDELGDEHLRTGAPILYTGEHSVCWVAAHESVVPVQELYRMCRVARKVLKPPHQIGRVVARPFAGKAGAFVSARGRRDFAVEPAEQTLLDEVKRSGQPVVGLGKIDDLFAGRGLTRTFPAHGQAGVMEELRRVFATVPRGLIVANVAPVETLDGRNDPGRFAEGWQEFDRRLPEIVDALRPEDALFITADHGHDPTLPHHEHTREYVPLLAYGPRLGHGVHLGTRRTCADLGQTIADIMGAKMLSYGESFLDSLQSG